MTNSKNTIFKTTFLFVFVQAYKLLIRILINKFAALFLGVEGIGIIGLFQNAISILQSGCGLGISQSAIRDLSIARATNAQEEVNKVVTITKRVILFTGIFGVIVTLGLAYPLSLWSFGSSDYTLSFIVLSLAVGIGIIAEGQLGILKGLRKMSFLAKADLLGSTAALLISIFLYYTLRLNGIIPALLVFFVSSYLFSAYFLTKIDYRKINIPWKTLFHSAKPMVKMGIGLITISFLSNIAALTLAAFVRKYGGLKDLGFYQAGLLMTMGYFGLINTALLTDYYPRITGSITDRRKVQQEVNLQIQISMILICPCIVIILMFLPYIITLIFSSSFLPASNYIKYAFIGMLILIGGNTMDLILFAKGAMSYYITIMVIFRIVDVGSSMLLYHFYGLTGLGFTVIIMGLLHFSIMYFTVNRLYNIYISWKTLMIIGITLSLATLAILPVFQNGLLHFIWAFILSVISIIMSLCFIREIFKVSLKTLIYTQINKFLQGNKP